MSVAVCDLIDDLRRRGALLSVRQDTLLINAPKGLVTPELKSELLASKPEILALLQTAIASRKNRSAVFRVVVDGKSMTMICPEWVTVRDATSRLHRQFGPGRVSTVKPI